MTQLPPQSDGTYVVPVLAKSTPCGRCGHRAEAHRLDDALDVSPVDPRAEFRCVGYPDGDNWVDTQCDCPDFEPSEIR